MTNETRDYAGDVTSAEAWKILSEQPDAVLLDVRTEAEWRYVGAPRLDTIGKHTIFAEWQRYPDDQVDRGFAETVDSHRIDAAATVLLICRSGARSRSAAIELTRHGFARCLNVADGFEGPLDAQGRRGHVAGWKVAGLPWSQS